MIKSLFSFWWTVALKRMESESSLEKIVSKDKMKVILDLTREKKGSIAPSCKWESVVIRG